MPVTLLDRPRARPDPPVPDGRRPAGRLTAVVDLAVLSALALFSAWTVLCTAAVVGALPSAVAFWSWVAGAPVVVWLAVRWLRPLLADVTAPAPWAALALAAAAAVAGLVIVRPDIDDAFYVARSTWIAANGDLAVGDVIFSDGAWPGLQPGVPYLQSFEGIVGWLARTSGMSVGTLLYVVVVPLASAGAIWALWLLLRAWDVRRPAAGLALACTFVLYGGATHASWGNFHLARIWQGKVVFLALLVPLGYALAAAFWRTSRTRARRAALAALVLAGIAGVGLTPAAVFVAPAVALAGTAPGLVQRRWADAAAVFAAGAGPALLTGAVLALAGGPSAPNPPIGEDPWVKVLGTGAPAAVVGLALAAALLACTLPGRWSASDRVGRWTAGASVVLGALVAVPALYGVAVAALGTDEITWRLTWVVPVPALVGLLAALPRWSVAVATAAVLVWGGLPLWSAANGAWVTPPTAWKIEPAVLEAARWVADRDPGGLVLAPVETAAALAVVTADVRPVGSRPSYMQVYEDRPGVGMPERMLLQRLADVPIGAAAEPADLDGAPAAFEALDVRIVCAHGSASPLAGAARAGGYLPAFANPDLNCFERPGG